MNKKILLVVLIIGATIFCVAYANLKKAHAPEVTACDMDAKICKDGSSVGRTGPSCEFAACPAGDSVILLKDAYPLYGNAIWSRSSASATVEGIKGVQVTSDAITDVTNISSVVTPYVKYYTEKLTALGWSDDSDLAADGPGSSLVGFKKGSERIIVSYDTTFLGTKPGAPVACPCTVTLSVFSGKLEAPGYQNATYIIEGKSVTLSNGLSVVPDADPSTGKTTTKFFGNTATGDLDDDGTEDVAFLLTQSGGGSGTFYYVATALKKNGSYVGTNALLLGDRIAPQTTEIRNGRIIVNYADRRATDPMSTPPSVGVSQYFKIEGGKLVVAK